MLICFTVLAVLCIFALIPTVVLDVILVFQSNKQNVPISETQKLPPWPPASVNPLGVYYKAAVAAENGICSEIGRDVMMRNGNAVDAAVATTFCMSVMNPQHSGLGGGHFMTIYLRAQQQCISIDARETAPKKASKNMYTNSLESTTGWRSIAVPGELHGLWAAHKNFGQLPWHSLIQPAISLLEGGVPVSSALAEVLKRNKNVIENQPTLKVLINNATGEPYKAGEMMKRPTLTGTFREIAASTDPFNLFYNGTMSQKVLKEFQTNGGIISKEDFASYKSIIRKPSITKMSNNLWACGPPPPSSAAVTHLIINILTGYPFTKQNISTVSGNSEIYHKLIESMKFAYSLRSELGDLDFVKNALNVTEQLSSEVFVSEIRKKITNSAHPIEYYGSHLQSSHDHGTTHISVLDPEGNAVAVTSSINLEFGSKRRSESTGIIWNDSMDDFSTPNHSNAFGMPPSSNNFIQPGKRPMSSMSPTVIVNGNSGNVRLVIGGAGGSRIISGTAFVAMRILMFNDTVKEAIDKPRIHNQLLPDYTEFEDGFPLEYIEALKEKGQKLRFGYSRISAVTAIERKTDGMIYANSDKRKGPASYPAGF